VIEVKKSEYKGKESAVIVLSSDDGKLIDAKFQLPMSEISKKQWEKLFTATNSDPKNAKTIIGKKVGIQINVNLYNGKKYYQPTGFCNPSLLVSETEGTIHDLGLGEQTSDELGF
jgi:hypothetical protein